MAVPVPGRWGKRRIRTQAAAKSAPQGPVSVAAGPLFPPEMDEIALVKRRRTNPQLIDDFVARPAFLYGFQTAVKQLQAVFPGRYIRCFEANALGAMRSRVTP